MIRIFIFLILVLLLGFGFSWFADRPGDVVLEWQGNQYETSLMVVLIGLVVLVVTIMVLWWLGRTILDSPRIMQRFFKARKKDRGYQALSKGLIAANSGDTASARRFTKESTKLLGNVPLVELLDAQSSLLEGKREEARSRFEKMLTEDETRLVALRGLYLEAERQGAGDAARHYAEEAHKESPSLAWAGNAKLRYASKEGNWESAIATLESNKSAGLVTKEEAKRQRSVLLTAQAMSVEPSDPVKAAKLAREAHKLVPSLVPAAIIGAKALARNSDIGRAAGMLEAVWKKEPHPEIAQSYIYLRLGDSAADRLKRAQKLAGMKANHREGNFIIAEAAIDVEDWKLAREKMLSVLSTAPTERACLIMADIEEAQLGDQGRMREWLSRAVRAPKDAAWTADGYVSEKWLPISPVTGKIDAFEWKLPVEQLGGPSNAVLDAESLEDLIREPEPAPVATPLSPTKIDETESEAAVAGAATVVAGSVAVDVALDHVTEDSPEEVIEAIVVEENIEVASESSGEALSDSSDVAEAGVSETPEEKMDATPASDTEFAEIEEKSATSGNGEVLTQSSNEKPEIVGSKIEGSENKDPENEKIEVADDPTDGFPLKRRPDDPGVREEHQVEKPKRFGLF